MYSVQRRRGKSCEQHTEQDGVEECYATGDYKYKAPLLWEEIARLAIRMIAHHLMTC